MNDFTTMRTCANCAQTYREELRRMRLNLHSLCPACGFPNSFSVDEAFRAQRLLEELEMKSKVAKAA
jgi:hypothetical protein